MLDEKPMAIGNQMDKRQKWTMVMNNRNKF